MVPMYKSLGAPFSVQGIPIQEPIYLLKALVKWHPEANRSVKPNCCFCVVQGEKPQQEPLPCEDNTNVKQHNVCDVCDLVFVTSDAWTGNDEL